MVYISCITHTAPYGVFFRFPADEVAAIGIELEATKKVDFGNGRLTSSCRNGIGGTLINPKFSRQKEASIVRGPGLLPGMLSIAMFCAMATSSVTLVYDLLEPTSMVNLSKRR